LRRSCTISSRRFRRWIAIVFAILATMDATDLFLAYADTISAASARRGIDAATPIVGFFVAAMGCADLPLRDRGDPKLCAGRAALRGWF
jgi:small neutral amino acid transporter SnatA (MarC family)